MGLLKRLAGLLGDDDRARAARLEQEARTQEARGDTAGALLSRRAVVDACRALAQSNPAERGNLAAALLNLGSLLAGSDDREGLDAALKGVDILRDLSSRNPGVRTVLALAYRTLAYIQWSFRLGPAAIESAQASIGLYGELRTQRPKELRLEHATSLIYLGLFLSEQGKWKQARDMALEALALHRELADDSPGAHPHELAGCLLVLSRFEHDLGLQDDAIHSAEAAVDLVRRADRDPGETAVLIRGLGNLSGYLGSADRTRQAFQAATEAVVHARELAAMNPHLYLGDLARSLLNLATQQGRMGLRQEAVTSAREAVALHREVVQKQAVPKLEATLGGLAASLGTLSTCEGKLGATREALENATEAVALHRKLAAAGSDESIEGLATTLTNFAIAQGQCGLLEAARDSQLEVVALYRRLIGRGSERHLPNLARSLSNLGVGHRRLGQRTEALASAREAVDINRQLTGTKKGGSARSLAIALSNLGAYQAEVGLNREGLATAVEAVAVQRADVDEDRDGHLDRLAAFLGNLAERQREAALLHEAIATAAEAVAIRRGLVARLPQAFLPKLSESLTVFSEVLTDLKRAGEGREAATEAVALRRQLAKENPQRYLPDLARSLDRLGVALHANGQTREALDTVSEAVALQRTLLLENRNGVLIDFAKSVCDLSSVQMSSDQLREARASAEEGVSAYADLASAYPLAFCAKLGGAIASLKGALERGGAALHDNEVLMRAEALASTTCLDRVD